MPSRAAYVDTSVLLKRYVQEEGSTMAQRVLRQFQIMTSALTPIEATSAMVRRQAEGDLAPGDFTAIARQFAQDRRRWDLVEVTPEVLTRAETVVIQTTVRTLDAIHLASALVVDAALGVRLTFVTADGRQRDAAHTLGLQILWVGP